MQLTSAQAAKLMRRLKEEKELLDAEEKSSKQFVVAIQEDAEAVRPAYDFHAMVCLRGSGMMDVGFPFFFL